MEMFKGGCCEVLTMMSKVPALNAVTVDSKTTVIALMKKHLLGAFLLLGPLAAVASSWVPVPVGAQDLYFADANSVSRDTHGNGALANYEVVRYAIDCRGRKMDNPAGRAYTTDGKVVASFDMPGPLKDIAPDTIAEAIADFSCKLARPA
jgi:hypothetical protein